MRVQEPRPSQEKSAYPNCDTFFSDSDLTISFASRYLLPLTPPPSQASSSDHHGSSPQCPSPPPVPFTVTANAPPPLVVGLPQNAGDLISNIRPRAFGREPLHLLLSPDLCHDCVERLKVLPRCDPLRYLRFLPTLLLSYCIV